MLRDDVLQRESATYCRFSGGINEPIEIISPFLWTRLVIKISFEFPQVLRLHDSLNRREPPNKLREPGGFSTLSSKQKKRRTKGNVFIIIIGERKRHVRDQVHIFFITCTANAENGAKIGSFHQSSRLVVSG